jgi:hypothetical protein
VDPTMVEAIARERQERHPNQNRTNAVHKRKKQE